MAGSAKRWTDKEIEIIRNNIETTVVNLASMLPGRSQLAIRIRLLKETRLIAQSLPKDKRKETPIGGDNIREGKFNPSKHRILNNDITGKIPVWVASERLTVYTDDASKIPSILAKYENRHKF